MVITLGIKKNKLLIIIMTLFFLTKGSSQTTNDVMQTIITAGNDITGNSGTVSYSIGQVFYTYFGNGTVFNVAQGVQHAEIETLGLPGVEVDKTDISVYPNPTSDFVNISMVGTEFENEKLFYKLYDIQGRLLRQHSINQPETQVNLNNLTNSIYILVVYVDNKVLKSFKILKK